MVCSSLHSFKWRPLMGKKFLYMWEACCATTDDTSILISGKDIQDLTLNLDKINKSILPWFDNNRLIINKEKSLALGCHHKLNKHIVFPDIILKDKLLTYLKQNFWESG
jgi:hypothetical protein